MTIRTLLLEMRGVEPRTFRMQSGRAATVPHPRCHTHTGHLLIIIPKIDISTPQSELAIFATQMTCCRMAFKLDDTCVYCAVLVMPWTMYNSFAFEVVTTMGHGLRPTWLWFPKFSPLESSKT